MNAGWQTQVPLRKWEGAGSGGLKECPRCGTRFQTTFDQHIGGWTLIFGCCGFALELDRNGLPLRPEFIVTPMGYHRNQ